MTSRPPNTSLPQKLGCLESEVLCKLLKRWSGRRGSNPRRPAWENGQCFVFSDMNAHGVDPGCRNANKTGVRFGWAVNGGFLEGTSRCNACCSFRTLPGFDL